MPWLLQHSSRSHLAVSRGVCGSVVSLGRRRWEVAATLNIALQGGAVLLMSPLASETVGVALHALTGKWNLEDYIGHDLLHRRRICRGVQRARTGSRTTTPCRRSFKQYVERPATLCIPLLLVTFSLGNGARIYKPDFFDVPTDFWLNIYWLLLCGTLIYLLGIWGARAARAAKGSAIPPHRQHLSRRLGRRHRRVRRPDRHRLRHRRCRLWTAAARWCGSSRACAAPGSRSRRRNPGDKGPSGSPKQTTELTHNYPATGRGTSYGAPNAGIVSKPRLRAAAASLRINAASPANVT